MNFGNFYILKNKQSIYPSSGKQTISLPEFLEKQENSFSNYIPLFAVLKFQEKQAI